MISDQVGKGLIRLMAAEAAARTLSGWNSTLQRVLALFTAVLLIAKFLIPLSWLELLVPLTVLLLLGGAAIIAVRMVRRAILAIGVPRKLRRALDGARDELRSEYERLGIPSGQLDVVRFAWQFARGHEPHESLRQRLAEAPGRVIPIIDEALKEAGEPRGIAAFEAA